MSMFPTNRDPSDVAVDLRVMLAFVEGLPAGLAPPSVAVHGWDYGPTLSWSVSGVSTPGHIVATFAGDWAAHELDHSVDREGGLRDLRWLRRERDDRYGGATMTVWVEPVAWFAVLAATGLAVDE